MTKYISFFLLLSGNVVQTLYAQNLVPNGGFEEAIECPTTLDALHFGCADWYKSIQVPGVEMYNNPSPDWYHTCSEFDELSPPNVAFSYQNPYEGNGLSAIITYTNSFTDGREVIGVQLTAPTNIGETYFVQFFASYGYSEITSVKSNNLGVKFTTYPIFENSADAVNNFSHFKIDTLITDSVAWLDVSFQFTADSVYEYLHIGNFYTDEFTLTELTEGDFNVYAYHFIDNVSVQSTLSLSERASLIEIYPNPVSSFLTVKNEKSIEKYQLYEITGMLMISESGNYNNVIRINTSDLKQGMYILQVLDVDGKRYIKKILKQ